MSWVIALVLVLTVFNQSKWKGRDVLKHDMYVYYSYLPATFIYHDLSFQFANDLPPDDKRQIWTLGAPNGGRVQKMTMGMAMMYAPAFGLAHLTAKMMGFPADGYSWIYHFFMAMSGVAFAIGALFIQRKLLLRFFDDKVVALALLGVALATNFYYYSTTEAPMSHVHNFFLISLFVWQSVKWLTSFRWLNALFMGLSLGLIILIRPVNVIVVLIPMLYGVRSFAEFVLRIGDVFKRYYQVMLMIGLIALVVSPQLLYWHANTGDWVYYSYNDEGFFFNDPRIWEGLFSFRKGWIIYAPIMSFSMLGLAVLWTRMEASKFKLAILVYFVLNLYIVFSWWCWWYGGSFGARPLVDATAIMSIPLAAFISIFQKKKFLKYGMTFMVVALVGLNLFQTMQYRRGIVHWDSMTKETYFLIFGNPNYPVGYAESIKTPDYDAAKKGDRAE
tara:strand:+ start:119035 stop:120369 length:1335 start_codon:yes stop_codon:yes gene_type:complete